MNVIYDKATNLIHLTSNEITSFIANPSIYTNIKISITINCETTLYKEVIASDMLNTNNPFYTNINKFSIEPIKFGLPSITDGIFSFEVKLNKSNSAGYILFNNCIFIDINYKCKVATVLKYLLTEIQDEYKEKVATNILLLHYAISNGSNCGCNCIDLCKAFAELTNLISIVNTKILEDCGC